MRNKNINYEKSNKKYKNKSMTETFTLHTPEGLEFQLRKWEKTDVDSLVKHADNVNVAKFLTDQFPHPYTKMDGEKYLEFIAHDNLQKVFAISINGEAIGSIGIFPESDIHKKNAEIGYWLSEKYWGKGIMAQAVKQIIAYGFNTFDITRIYSRPFAINKGSQRVLQKAGMAFEARFEKSVYKNGAYYDEIYYAVRKL